MTQAALFPVIVMREPPRPAAAVFPARKPQPEQAPLDAPSASPGDDARLSKHQMIEAIRQRNRSASAEFLVRFDERTLEMYLQRLTQVLGHRGRRSVWVRPDVSPAIVTRASA